MQLNPQVGFFIRDGIALYADVLLGYQNEFAARPSFPNRVNFTTDTWQFGIGIGARNYFPTDRAVRPYVAAELGWQGQTTLIRIDPDIRERNTTNAAFGLLAVGANYFLAPTVAFRGQVSYQRGGSGEAAIPIGPRSVGSRSIGLDFGFEIFLQRDVRQE